MQPPSAPPLHTAKQQLSKQLSASLKLNLNKEHFHQEHKSHPTHTPSLLPYWRQTTLSQFFNVSQPPLIPKPPSLSPSPSSPHAPVNKKFKNVRQAVLSYRRSKRSINKITRYTVSLPSYDLFDSWGHSLETIDANTTFRLFLQNPNGLSIHRNNHFLLHDFQTCFNYGASVLCLRETNTNWDQPSQLPSLRSLFHKIWRKTSLQTSHTPDPFLSDYQPGGTLTAVCDNWVSRVLTKGEDPFGLGRWSYVTLRGKGSTKVTVITAYNATPSPGDSTYYHQQLRLLTRMHRQQQILEAPDPRRQFVLDLQAWVEFLQIEGHQIILAMDANEVYDPDSTTTAYPLPYDSSKVTMAPSHSGKLATLVTTCGLCLPLAHQHSTRPFPASHIRGRSQIDYIFVSQALLPAVQRSGVLSHHSLIRGDHRPYFLDFDASLLFADPAYNIAPASSRNLRLQDPRVVQKYRERLHQLLDQNNVFPRLDLLQDKIKSGNWTESCCLEYEALDETITTSMLTAEKDLSRRVTTTYQWSPKLKAAVHKLRYWHLRLRQVRHLPVNLNQLDSFRHSGEISDQEHSLQTEVDIKMAQSAAFQTLKELQSKHQELRESYLEDLAEAIVLERSPYLEDDKQAHILLEKKAKQIRQLISREKMRQMYRKIGRALKKPMGGGLSRIDVPDARAASTSNGDPENPKQWKGPWRSVTNPREIAKEVCKINSAQYHQAHYTPFGSGPLADMIGRKGDTPTSQDLLRGQLPDPLPPELFPETVRILKTLATPVPSAAISSTVSPEEFVNTYRLAHEDTSSSPSGRHVGHYKAVLKDPSLVSLHSQMMSIPFQAGFAPQRWSKVTDIMLEKEQDNPRCHRLRILALFESDLNHAKRVIIGRRLLHHMRDTGLLPAMQHGSVPGKHCLSAVLKKVLCHDYLRITKRAGAFIENDAVGCYDRLVNNLVLIIMTKLGMPKTVVACIGDLWDQVVHLIKTIYGISSVTYGNTKAKPLYGPGQGSTCGPLFWLLCYWVIVSSLDPTITAAKFFSACKSILVEITGVSFVDDTSLCITSEYVYDHTKTVAENRQSEVAHLVENLSALSQHWERLLFTTGGAINFQKSHWYLMAWLWNNGIPRLATVSQTPASMTLTTGASPILEQVPRIESSTGFRTLGVYLTPSGNYSKQVQILRNHAETFKANLTPSSLTSAEAYCCYMLFIRPKINYPLPCVSLTQAQCRYIQAPLLETILPKLHLNRHTPRAVIFAGPRYGGIGIPETYTDLGLGHLSYFVGHLKIGDEVGQFILTLITHTQLQTGSVTSYFSLKYPAYNKWIDTTWITDIWKVTNQAGITIEVEDQWLPWLSRQHDVALMDFALSLNLPPYQLQCINTCRMHLQVTTLSDIVTAKGDSIVSCIMEGERDLCRPTTLLWPEIPSPPPSFWRQWRQFLQHLLTGRVLHQPLGAWVASPLNSWTWYIDALDRVWHHNQGTNAWTEYDPVDEGQRRLTRSSARLYMNGIPSQNAPQHRLYPVTITHRRDGHFHVHPGRYQLVEAEPKQAVDLWQHTFTPPALVDTPPFFQHLLSTPISETACQELALELQEGTLIACSDGSHDPDNQIASHGVVFASSLLQQTLVSIAGPVDGHPKLVTSYRAELSGIIACLYLVYRICQYFQLNSGKILLYCDNKGALENSFRPIYPGVTPYLKTDHDLVEIIRTLLALIPITVTHDWVKGHYSGNKREFQHDLNEEADRLAGAYQREQTPHYTIRKPLIFPGYKVRLLHDSSVITAKAASILVDAYHSSPIVEHIMHKAKWSKATFELVHWDAHEKAFKRLHRYHQHSTAKLIHGLVNTNRQNHLFYGTTSQCPICSSEEETLLHVFTCSHPSAIQHRQSCLEKLLSTLDNTQTPQPIIDTIQYGFQQWTGALDQPYVRAPTAGSLRGPDAILTSAFHEQFYTIGWYHFCLGRVSKLWARAVTQYTKPDRHPYTPLHWSSLLVSSLWTYSKTVWKFRNEIVHGATVEEQARRMITGLQASTTAHYTAYYENPQIVLARHQFLFTAKTLEERLRAPYDTLAAWLRSVEEALQVVRQHTEVILNTAQVFLPVPNSQHSTDTDSTYTAASLQLSDTTISLDSTTTTAASTCTLTSTGSHIETLCHSLRDQSDGSSVSSTPIYPSLDILEHSSWSSNQHPIQGSSTLASTVSLPVSLATTTTTTHDDISLVSTASSDSLSSSTSTRTDGSSTSSSLPSSIHWTVT